jgi:C1A family cysteine protease
VLPRPVASENAMGEPYHPTLGWLRDLPDARDFGPDHCEVREQLNQLKRPRKTQRVLPASVDLSEYFSAVPHAEGLNASPAWACAALVEYFQRRALGNMTQTSAAFLYKVTCKLLRRRNETGLDLRSTLKALVRFGLPSVDFCANDASRLDTDPDPILYSSYFTEPFRSIRYVRLDARNATGSQTLKVVKSFLAAGFPSVFGISVPASIASGAEVLYRPASDSVLGGQALLAAGYDDRRLGTTKGALRIRNSCDPTWGESGYGWLPYVYVEEQLAVDFWTVLRKDWLASDEFLRPIRKEKSKAATAAE